MIFMDDRFMKNQSKILKIYHLMTVAKRDSNSLACRQSMLTKGGDQKRSSISSASTDSV